MDRRMRHVAFANVLHNLALVAMDNKQPDCGAVHRLPAHFVRAASFLIGAFAAVLVALQSGILVVRARPGFPAAVERPEAPAYGFDASNAANTSNADR
ncbi:MAG: hypothetical protein AAFN74_08480, partial [Myxococcota bacterium]